MTFSVLFTFTDFQLIWVMTRGGPVNATHLMATFSYQRAIMSGYLGEGAAISTAMIPFLLPPSWCRGSACSGGNGSRAKAMTDALCRAKAADPKAVLAGSAPLTDTRRA